MTSLPLPAPHAPLYLPAPPSKPNTSFHRTNNFRKKKSTQYAKVNHLTQEDVNEANNVVTCTLLVCSHDAKVLFDSGATHSFVSCKFLNNRGIESDLLRKRLCVESPMAGMIAKRICHDCSIMIKGRIFFGKFNSVRLA
jgi:hypothetical protein